ncbi:hypothetical protein [Roseibium polysiphoniae]|uniref:Uncharacterized protein n=1 Tax=Roseibium polysiphoniae TaxID=2571221 RepID=A0ABR9C920_9HYPH|nr:hypothetical protein [Roseibium polysiphoniae]MBD8875422.1 hypothetical protein [Roseibium polysiphoniae]
MAKLKPAKLDNTDPLRLTSAKQARTKEAARRAGYQRGAYLEWLYNNRKIKKAQYLAGCRVRALFAEREGRAKSMDLSNDRVDGGNPERDFLRVATLDADRSLKDLAAALGPDQAFVLFHGIGLGLPIQEVAAYFVEPDKVGKSETVDRISKDYCGRLIKDGLHHAAFFFGYATRAAETQIGKRSYFWYVKDISTINGGAVD